MEGLEEAWAGLLDLIVVIFVVSPVRDFIFLILSFFLGRFRPFFDLKMSYYEYCNINLLNLGLNTPGLGWEGASKAGQNPKRPNLFEKSRDPF